MISPLRYWSLLLAVGAVYIAGMFTTLFENDSAQFAVMAMRMVQENDFLNLFKGPHEYLDKPHMHYWLAALSFKIFGIHDWAYRIPGILATFLGAYSCYGLGSLLYTKQVGKLAALIFLSCQTIVLGGIDVRTDAVLTGFTIFSIWQLAAYVERNALWHAVLGAFGAGMAFSTKGQIALVVIGICLLCHVGYARKWDRVFNWRVLVALVVFGLTITPMLYAYYQQFDLQPEKVIRGRNNRSGIFFIFWEQSFERMSGEGMGKNSSDFFFFFHTFLWVFLPWSVLALVGYWGRLVQMAGLRLRYVKGVEFLTLGGISLIFFLISFAQFKLPHYMNVIMPLYALLTAAFILGRKEGYKPKERRFLLGIQYFILVLVVSFSLVVAFWVFPFDRVFLYVLLFIFIVAIGYFALKQDLFSGRLVTVSVMASVLLNLVMNLHFYPRLLGYQGGSAMAKKVGEQEIKTEDIYKIGDGHTWALDFYNRKPVAITTATELAQMEDVWVYANDNELKKLQAEGLVWDRQLTVDQFRITRLQLKFLNPATRAKKLNRMHLVHLE